jgi:hypothetical protein
MRAELHRLLTLGTFIALLLAGCGGEQIPPKTASVITAGLERVDKRVRAGECDDARRTLQTLDERVQELPRGVDPPVRRTLSRGVDHLGALVRKECKQKPQPEPVEEPVVQPPVVTTPEPPAVTQPERSQIEKPEKPQMKPEKPQIEKPDKPDEPEKPKEPTEKEKDICGEDPAPQC